MSRRSWYQLASALLVTVFACDAKGVVEPDEIYGTYELVTVSGSTVPVVRRETAHSPACLRAGVTGDLIERVNSGELELSENASFHLLIRTVRICTYGSTVTSRRSEVLAEGHFEVVGGQIVLDPIDPDWADLVASPSGSGVMIGLQVPNDVFRDYGFRLSPW